MILTALKDLESKSPADIATQLEVNGVRGAADSGVFNPLALWLERFAEEPIDYIAVAEDVLYITAATGQSYYIALPDNVSQFVKNFEDGLYPALEGVPCSPGNT